MPGAGGDGTRRPTPQAEGGQSRMGVVRKFYLQYLQCFLAGSMSSVILAG